MANRAAIVVVALVVGAGLYSGIVLVEGWITAADGAAADDDVVLASATLHLDRVGRPTVVGEVHNGRRSPVAPTVTVRFRREGRLLGSASGPTLVPTVAGADASPFAIRLPNRTARPDEFEVDVDYDADADAPYAGLAIADEHVADRSGSQVIVVGTVRNVGDRRVTAHVVATFYDADGSVIGARSARPSPDVLEPEAEGEFTVRFRTLGDLPSRAGDVDRYELTTYGEPVE